MSDVTDRQHRRDPWTDPDPQPEDFEEFLSDPANYEVQHVPAGTMKVVLLGNQDVDEWLEKRAAARARGERLAEEIEADEPLGAAGQAL